MGIVTPHKVSTGGRTGPSCWWERDLILLRGGAYRRFSNRQGWQVPPILPPAGVGPTRARHNAQATECGMKTLPENVESGCPLLDASGWLKKGARVLEEVAAVRIGCPQPHLLFLSGLGAWRWECLYALLAPAVFDCPGYKLNYNRRPIALSSILGELESPGPQLLPA